jgi:hypothetical protein
MDSRFGGYDTNSSNNVNFYNGDWLTAGTLEIKGDFTQLSSGPYQSGSYNIYYPERNFHATDSHTTILWGSYSFEDPSTSYFNEFIQK